MIAYSLLRLFSPCYSSPPDPEPQYPSMGPIYTAIMKKLTAALKPVSFKLTDTTFEHHGHAAHVRDEQYFRLSVVSHIFNSMPSHVERHRLIYKLLEVELRPVEQGGGGVHALEISCKAPGER